MKLHHAILLLIAAKQTCFAWNPATQECEGLEHWNYEFVEGKDSNGNDIRNEDNHVLEDMAEECKDSDNCLAFNTNGWLKHTVVHPLTSVDYGYDCGGVYIKCLDWAGLKDAIADDQTPSGQQTKYTLCSGTYNIGSNDAINLNSKNVAIGCANPNPDAGCVLRGALTSDRAFEFTASTAINVELSNLTFEKFKTAIHLYKSGMLKLNQCTFQDNEESAVYVVNGQITISNSLFKDNKSNTGAGGALDCTGGGTSCTLRDSVFEGNQATGGHLGNHGGGIACSFSAVCDIDDSTFVSNSASKGGAIYCRNGATCEVDEGSFQSNSASQGPNIYCDTDTSATCNLGCLVFPNTYIV